MSVSYWVGSDVNVILQARRFFGMNVMVVRLEVHSGRVQYLTRAQIKNQQIFNKESFETMPFFFL